METKHVKMGYELVRKIINENGAIKDGTIIDKKYFVKANFVTGIVDYKLIFKFNEVIYGLNYSLDFDTGKLSHIDGKLIKPIITEEDKKIEYVAESILLVPVVRYETLLASEVRVDDLADDIYEAYNYLENLKITLTV